MSYLFVHPLVPSCPYIYHYYTHGYHRAPRMGKLHLQVKGTILFPQLYIYLHMGEGTARKICMQRQVKFHVLN